HAVAVDVAPADVLGLLLGACRVVAELAAARLASAPRKHLRLDDHLAADLLRGRACLRRARGEPALRHRNPEAPEELLALVLVEVHRRLTLAAETRSSGGSQAGPPLGRKDLRRIGKRRSVGSASWTRSLRTGSRSAIRTCTRWPASRSPSGQARSSGCSGRTAPASRRPSRCSPR